MKKIKIIIIFVFLFFGLFANQIKAEDQLITEKNNQQNNDQKLYQVFLDYKTILKGYTVSAFSSYLKLSLVPDILSQDTQVLIEEIPAQEMELPWNLKKESAILQFEFVNKLAYDNHKPFYIQLSYDQSSNNYKQVFFYDRNHGMWRPLPTWDFPQEKFVRSLIHLPFARIAVFSYPEISTIGQASWYKHKGGNFTASTDFPKGSVLRVHNLSNKKFVDVVVNDFGPDRSVFSDRILDLDYEAFKKIAGKEEGVIDVFVEPLKIMPGEFSRKPNIEIGTKNIPEIKSTSAIIIRESDNQIVLEKNADQIMPIASLTKIFSVYNFLQEGNNKENLEKIIKYSNQDEDYNLKYFSRSQIARINLNDGDLLSVKDLIYSALVRSANNVVETLVRISGLDRDDFIKKVNNWAKNNGASSFKINEPTGLDKNNVSSAKDLAFLASKVFQEKIIGDASSSGSYKFFTRNDNSLKLRYNSSDLVLNNNYRNFKITGSKTGYLDEAGYCLITQAIVKGEKFLVVILDSPSRVQSFSETMDLLNYAYYLSN